MSALDTSAPIGVRGHLIHFLDDPAQAGSSALQTCEDGVLILDHGRIVASGSYAVLKTCYESCDRHYDYRDKWLMPGFIDAHTHYVQSDIIASPSHSLLDWLNRYTFAAEAAFGDREHAAEVATYFLGMMLKNGVTSASIFSSVHPVACDALFAVAQRMGMRINAGKVLMDQHAPDALCDPSGGGIESSVDLIERWHGVDRMRYSITPRFVPTSSAQQLARAGELYQSYPGLHLQSHVAENQQEVAWVQQMYPDARSYLAVYEKFGLLGPRSTYAHGIYLDESDWRLLHDSGTSLAFCPTSNLFLGSGLFNLSAARQHGVTVGLATDVGGGDSFSMFATMNQAYKVCQLLNLATRAPDYFYMATLGAARALGLDQFVGNFDIGKEADFVVIDPVATPLLERRQAHANSFEEQLFALMMLADDRAISQVHLLGVPMFV